MPPFCYFCVFLYASIVIRFHSAPLAPGGVHSREAGEQEAGTGGFLLLASFYFYLLASIY